ncbi:MAG: group II intron reverse transcriptase/maturase, partial [Methylococcaceae bacterium]
MKGVRHVLERLDLTLNDKKSRTVDARKEHFAFLGFSIRVRTSRVTGNRYPHVEPSAKSLMPEVVKEVNQVLRGWTGYFHYRNSTRMMGKLRYHVEERIRTHLGKRHKV